MSEPVLPFANYRGAVLLPVKLRAPNRCSYPGCGARLVLKAEAWTVLVENTPRSGIRRNARFCRSHFACGGRYA